MTAPAAVLPASPPAEVATLANGVRAVLLRSAANDIVAVRVYLTMGPFFESEGESGLSNLLQEMLLHGTRRRNEEEMQDALADLGAKLTTAAANDSGSVTLRVARGQLAEALELLDDVLTSPALDEEELAKEKVRILNRIKAQQDSLLTAAFELFRETFFEGHPYHKPILGYPATVPGFGVAQVAAARARFYQPQRLVVSAVGNFDLRTFARRLEQLVLPLPDGPAPVRSAGRVVLPASREVARRRESHAAWVVVGFPVASYRDPDYAATRLLDAILGGSMNSRLFSELREKRSLAYQVSSYYNDQLGHSFLAGYIGTSPEKFAEARAAMLGEFERIAEERVSDLELERAKKYLQGSYIISAETNAAQASRRGRYELYGLGQDFGDRLMERVASVTAEEIRAVGEACFGRHVLAAIHPDEASLERLAREGPPPELYETNGTEDYEEESG